MQNLIAHLDSDCFYVSAERVRAEKYNHCPVGVLGNNGACVIAKSYELREYGVKTGELVGPLRVLSAPWKKQTPFSLRFRWLEFLLTKMESG